MPASKLRLNIARQSRRLKPDAPLTANYDVAACNTLNQPNHRVAGAAARANHWSHRELLDVEGYESRTAQLLRMTHPGGQPTHVVEIGQPASAAAVASQECHEARLADPGNYPAPAGFPPQILNMVTEMSEAELGMGRWASGWEANWRSWTATTQHPCRAGTETLNLHCRVLSFSQQRT